MCPHRPPVAPRVAAAWLSFLAVAAAVTAGDLAPPPGPVSPTMKSLVSVEPRTEVNAANTPGDATAVFVISSPGSYSLGGNLTGVSGKHGIRINASDVTIDLNGFTLIGAPGSLNAIDAEGSSPSRISVRNGAIVGWTGAVAAFFSPGSRFADLRIESCTGPSVRTGDGSSLTDISVRLSSGYAFDTNGRATIERCSASAGLTIGFYTPLAVLRGCSASGNAGSGFAADKAVLVECTSMYNTGAGFDVSESVVTGCLSTENSGSGFLASGTMLRGCVATANDADGFELLTSCSAQGCSALNNADDGFSFGQFCTVRGNSSTGNAFGFYDTGAGFSRVDENDAFDNASAGFYLTGDRGVWVRNTGRNNNADIVVASATYAQGPIMYGAGSAASTFGAWTNFMESSNRPADSPLPTCKPADKRSTSGQQRPLRAR